jgi:bifunctional polynucleotide phosphatase/kinase
MRQGWDSNESETIMFTLHEENNIFKSKLQVRFIGFDLDGTLITTKTGKEHPIDATDWKFRDEKVKQKLQELWREGCYMAILSNQGGIKQGFRSDRALQIRTKVDEIIRQLGVPIDFICALGSASVYRKPSPGMWNLLSRNRCPNLDRDVSQFVGDAAGRVGDFADTDLKMALNAGVGYQTPEEFFSL